MLECVGSPGYQDEKSDEDGTERVDIPYDAGANNRHDQTKYIDDDVVSVVDKEDVNCGISAEEETVDA